MAKKRISLWKWGAMGLPMAIVLAVLVYNNMEQLGPFNTREEGLNHFSIADTASQDTAEEEIFPEDPETESSLKKNKNEESGKKKEEPKEKPPKSDPDPAKKLVFSFKSPKIICPLKTEPLLYVILQLEFLYSKEKLKEELKFRETDVKGIIQNIIYQSEREELKAETIREKILKSLNQLLNHGSIEDVIFRDFKIEIRKK